MRAFTAWIVGAAVALAIPRAASAAETCYRLPFTNPNLADGWGSTCCGRTNPHRGVDFPQASGTAIPAVADGIVRRVPYSGCLGNVVIVQHSDGMYSGYSHLLSASPLAEGTKVNRGDTVGRVGNTGTCSFGAHLHLTISATLGGYASGTTVDPYKYITTHTSCNRPPRGAFDSATCDAITGWAQDQDDAAATVNVRLYVGGPSSDPKAQSFTVPADVHRADLCTSIGSCKHGFSTFLPMSFRDGVERPIFAYAMDSKGSTNTELGNKKIKCAPPPIPPGTVRRYIPNAEVLTAWKFGATEIATLSDGDLAAVPRGPDLSSAPALVRSGADVFVREHRTVRHVLDVATLARWELDAGAAKEADVAAELRGAPWMAAPFLAKGSGPEVYLLDAPPPLWAELIDDNVPEAMAPGATADVTFRFRNRGSLQWDNVSLAPTPREVASALCDPSWPSCTRIGAVNETAGEATVKAKLRAPAVEGVVTACFGLVTGEHWFSDPGANGPADDALCRTIRVSSTAREGVAADDEPAADGAAEDLRGGCGCHMVSPSGGASLGVLIGFALLAATRRRH